MTFSRTIAGAGFAVAASLAIGSAVAEPLSWPTYGPDRGHFRVDGGLDRGDGLTNSLPDVVGPMDGTARLTIFTEGNHYPVLLPLALEAFPAWCAIHERCAIAAEDILVVTLPQVMVMAGLRQEGFRLGNAQWPVTPDGPVFPDIVMLGAGPMGELARMELVDGPARVFARHRGLGLLVGREHADTVTDLKSFADSELDFVIATTREAGARNQYQATLTELLGDAEAQALMARETPDFPGRLGIQHRDIPYAVMNDIAPAGVIFGHLARFYAEFWPEQLAFVEIPEAEPFGQEISAARTTRASDDAELVTAFMDFLFEAAPDAYDAGGFSPADAFAFGRELDLAAR